MVLCSVTLVSGYEGVAFRYISFFVVNCVLTSYSIFLSHPALKEFEWSSESENDESRETNTSHEDSSCEGMDDSASESVPASSTGNEQKDGRSNSLERALIIILLTFCLF